MEFALGLEFKGPAGTTCSGLLAALGDKEDERRAGPKAKLDDKDGVRKVGPKSNPCDKEGK